MSKRKKPEDKKHPGRGDALTEDEIKILIKQVCAIMSKGKALCNACEDVGIAPQSFYEWMAVYKWIAAEYARAKQDRAEAEFDRLEKIENQVLTGEIQPNAGRVVIDSMKWRLGKMAGKYSDNKYLLEHAGKDGDAINIKMTDLPPQPKDLAEWESWVKGDKK